MNAFQVNDTLGDVVARCPVLSRVFEEAGIDYCCGGKKTLDEICREKGLDSQTLLATLEESVLASAQESVVDAAAMSLTELAGHIEQTHHTYLRSELPRLDTMTEKVASVHGKMELTPFICSGRHFSNAGFTELSSHMMKEEQILFPMVRQLDASETTPTFHCGSLANPIQQMESRAYPSGGRCWRTLHELTDGYSAS